MKRGWLFLCAALGSELIYVTVFLQSFWLPSYCSIPLLPSAWPQIFQHPDYTGVSFPVFSVAIGALCGLYLLLLWIAPSARPSFLVVFLGATALAGTLALSYPVFSNDIFLYHFYGRVTVLHQGDPYVDVPGEFQGDPFLSLVDGVDLTLVYGPLWHWMEAATALGAGDSCVGAILGLKAWAILFLLADTLLIYRLLRPMGSGQATLGALLFGWNPLTLIESAANAHNDAAMLFFLLLGVYFLERGRRLWALSSYLLAASIKQIPLLLLPVILVALWRRVGPGERMGFGIKTLLLSAALVATVDHPFVLKPGLALSNLGRAYQGPEFWVPLPTAALQDLGLVAASAGPLPTTLLTGIFVMLFLLTVAVHWRRGVEAPRASFAIFLFYNLLANGLFQAWHVLWPLAFAALCPDGRVRAMGICFALTSLPRYVLSAAFPEAGWVMNLFTLVPTAALALWGLPALWQGPGPLPDGGSSRTKGDPSSASGGHHAG